MLRGLWVGAGGARMSRRGSLPQLVVVELDVEEALLSELRVAARGGGPGGRGRGRLERGRGRRRRLHQQRARALRRAVPGLRLHGRRRLRARGLRRGARPRLLRRHAACNHLQYTTSNTAIACYCLTSTNKINTFMSIRNDGAMLWQETVISTYKSLTHTVTSSKKRIRINTSRYFDSGIMKLVMLLETIIMYKYVFNRTIPNQ